MPQAEAGLQVTWGTSKGIEGSIQHAADHAMSALETSGC